MKNFHKVYDAVSTRIRKAQDHQANYFNKKHREVTPKIGDIVLRRNKIVSSAADKIAAKLALKYKGTYIVTGKISTNIYEITDCQGDSCGPVNVEDLKKDYGNQDEFHTEKNKNLIKIEDALNAKRASNKQNNKLAKKPRGRPRKTRVIVKLHTIKTCLTRQNPLK